MEKLLYQWYLNERDLNSVLTAKMVKEKAKQLSKCKDFIASKGWLDKFKVRYGLEIEKEPKGRKSSFHRSKRQSRFRKRSLKGEIKIIT